MDSESDDELDQRRDWDEDSSLWEYQLHPLTVERLQLALSQASVELPVRVVLYDGSGDREELVPMELGLTGLGEHQPQSCSQCIFLVRGVPRENEGGPRRD